EKVQLAQTLLRRFWCCLGRAHFPDVQPLIALRTHRLLNAIAEALRFCLEGMNAAFSRSVIASAVGRQSAICARHGNRRAASGSPIWSADFPRVLMGIHNVAAGEATQGARFRDMPRYVVGSCSRISPSMSPSFS